MQNGRHANTVDDTIHRSRPDPEDDEEPIAESEARGAGRPLLLIAPADAASDETHRAIAGLEQVGLKVGKEYSGDSQTVYTARGGE